jgi:hypothetical protein
MGRLKRSSGCNFLNFYRIDLFAEKKEQVAIDAALSQGLPKCRYSHVVSSQLGYLEVRQKRCTHT